MNRQNGLMCLSLILLLGILVPPAVAQQTQKPADVDFLPVTEPGQRVYRPWEGYELSGILEIGGQGLKLSGNEDMYRAHQNYRNGFNVFNFDVRARGTNGAFFSDYYVQGGGWGNDPYRWARFGFNKVKWFDFKGSYRQSEYVWAFPGFARDQHRNDTTRRLQSYDLILFPKQKFRLKAGYSRNSSFGFALTTYDFSRDEFPLFENVRQSYDEYRVGADWTFSKWSLFFLQSFRYIRNDRRFSLLDDFDPGNDAGDATTLSVVDRNNPIRTDVPSSRLTLTGRPHPKLDVTARILYSNIDMDATRSEFNAGTNFGGNPIELVFDTAAVGSRPNTVADLAVTWRPVRGFTLSNTFRFNQFSIAGFQRTGLLTTDPVGGTTTPSEETFASQLRFDSKYNRVEGRYDFNRTFGVRGGYIRTTRNVSMLHIEDGVPGELEETTLDTDTFLLGANLRLNRTFRLFFDYETGEFDNVFTRLSAANIDRLRVRTQWQPTEGVRFNTSWFLFDNVNPNPLINSDQENRGYALDFQYFRQERFYVNLGYSRNDINTATDVQFFTVRGAPLQTGTSIYVANDNYAYVDLGGRLAGNLYADLGYRLVFNSGTFPASDPVGTCAPFEVGSSCDNLSGLDPLGINWGGLNYHQPHVGLRYAFSDAVNWKAGYRWYNYNQKSGSFSDYKAHVITTSLVLNF